jgi:flagella basal body P-ring formation protein FlgA
MVRKNRFLAPAVGILLLATVSMCPAALGESGSFGYESEPRTAIQIVGKSQVTATEPILRLADIADVFSARQSENESVITLRNISLGSSPKPGETTELDARMVLDRLRDEGVRLDEIRYTFPRAVVVKRAFREVSLNEIEDALRGFLSRSRSDMELRRVEFASPVRVAANAAPVEAISYEVTNPGRIGVDFRARGTEDEVRFRMKALVDEWRMVPVAKRVIKSGATVSADDVELLRANVASVGKGVIDGLGDIIGATAARDIGQGEVFQKGSVIIPPTIVAGSRVTLLYRSGGLEASATGTALQSGAVGADIQVRNESSKKVVIGRVLESGIVSVVPARKEK